MTGEWAISEAVPGTMYLIRRVGTVTRYMVNLEPDPCAPMPYRLTQHGDNYELADTAYFRTLSEAVHSVQASEELRVEPQEAF